MSEGYTGLPAYYLQSSDPITPNLLLSLKGMDPIVAEDFVKIDTFAAGPFGSTLDVNGVPVAFPNFVNSATVVFSVVGSNVSATAITGGETWAALTGDLTKTQIIPWDGPTIGTPDTGISRLSSSNFAQAFTGPVIGFGNGVAGNYSATLIIGQLLVPAGTVYTLTAAAHSVVDIEPTFVGTSGNQWSAYYEATVMPPSNSTANYIGEKQVLFFNSSANINSTAQSCAFQAQGLQVGSGTIGIVQGANILSCSFSLGAGTITENDGISVQSGSGFAGSGGGSITNDYTIHIESPEAQGVLFNHYGLYIADQTTGGANNQNPWAIYSVAGKNFFGGALILGAAPGAPSSASTAGTVGQVEYFGGLLYFCSVTGAAGAATWNKLSMAAV